MAHCGKFTQEHLPIRRQPEVNELVQNQPMTAGFLHTYSILLGVNLGFSAYFVLYAHFGLNNRHGLADEDKDFFASILG